MGANARTEEPRVGDTAMPHPPGHRIPRRVSTITHIPYRDASQNNLPHYH